MDTIRFSMNGYRVNMVRDMKELYDAIYSTFDSLDEYEKNELIDKFNTIACNVNALNYVWIDGNDSFVDMSSSPEVPLLEELEYSDT